MDEHYMLSKYFSSLVVPVVNMSTLLQPPPPALAHLKNSQGPITNGTAIKRDDNPALQVLPQHHLPLHLTYSLLLARYIPVFLNLGLLEFVK